MTTLDLENGRLTDDSVDTLRQHTDMLACQCPGKLLEILDSIRSFTDYSNSCIVQYPADAQTHVWLRTAAQNLDKLLCGTVMQLARMEGFVDDNNQLIPRAK